MSEWEDIPQALAPPSRARPACRLGLAVYGRASSSNLVVAVTADLAHTLGWSAGMRVGAALGTLPRTAGWLRVAPAPSGRPLRNIGKRTTLLVALVPPKPWRHLTVPSTGCEYRIQGDALLIEIPWDMDSLAATPAEENAA